MMIILTFSYLLRSNQKQVVEGEIVLTTKTIRVHTRSVSCSMSAYADLKQKNIYIVRRRCGGKEYYYIKIHGSKNQEKITRGGQVRPQPRENRISIFKFVTLVLKGHIYHLTKWQIQPFNTKVVSSHISIE